MTGQNVSTVPVLALALAVDAADRRLRQIEWLARQLALLGVHPCPRLVQDASGEAVEDMTREWLVAGHKVAENAGRRVSG